MAADPSHTITLTLAADNTLAAGAVTVTCGGLTLAAKPMVAAASGLTIKTSKDTVAASVAIPAVGAVTATAASVCFAHVINALTLYFITHNATL
jgi:hypothetical protein